MLHQIAEALEYLHSNQVAHLNVQTNNILLWKFPMPSDCHQERIQQAGDILVKVSGFTISRISPDLRRCVGKHPNGSPSFMAPELFGEQGLIISLEKVN